MEDYKPNSHAYKAAQAAKQEEKKVEKVIKGTAKVKKKNEVSKLKEAVISEDASNVKSYIIMDILIPSFKKAISDIVTNGIDMILYGGNGSPNRKRSTADRVSYNRYYDQDDRYRRTERNTRYSYDDITLETRGEAEEVLDQLDALIDTYGVASVADLYDLVGITGEYTDNKYGWTNVRNAKVIRDRHGEYLLRLPKVIPIK